ncbi:MAG: type II toxin-antitoxin system RelE/ParE family toxin [Gemmatimonadota bacterium]
MDEAISFIAADSRLAAAKQLERILGASASLAELPDRGRTVPDLDDPQFRELDPGTVLVGLPRGEDKVWIVALIHTSQEFSGPPI